MIYKAVGLTTIWTLDGRMDLGNRHRPFMGLIGIPNFWAPNVLSATVHSQKKLCSTIFILGTVTLPIYLFWRS